MIRLDHNSENGEPHAKSVTDIKFENRQSIGSVKGYQRNLNRKSVLEAIFRKTSQIIKASSGRINLLLFSLILIFSLSMRFVISHQVSLLG